MFVAADVTLIVLLLVFCFISIDLELSCNDSSCSTVRHSLANLGSIVLAICLKDGWESRWVKSDWKRSEGKAGSFKHTAGKWAGDPDDKGMCYFVALELDILVQIFLYT